MAVTYAVSISGGTALGAFQLPIIEHLQRTRGNPSALAGVSIGSVQVAMWGEGRLRELREEWERLDGKDGFVRTRWWAPWGGLYDLSPLRRRLRLRRAGARLLCPTHVGVVDVATRDYQSIDLGALSLADRHDAVIASCTLPRPVMVPAYLRGRRVMDGGAWGHVIPPLSPAMLEGVDEWHLLVASPVGRDREAFPGEGETSYYEDAEAAYERALATQIAHDLRVCRDIARATGTKLRVWAPESWTAIGRPFDASRQRIRARFRHAEAIIRRSAP